MGDLGSGGGGVRCGYLVRDGLRWSIGTSTIEFLAMRETWETVYAASPAANPFLSWEWHYNWWSSFGRGRELALIALHDGDRPVAVAPLCIQRERFHGLSLRRARFISSSEVSSDYLDFLIAPGFERAALDTIFELLRTQFSWDVLAISDVPQQSPTRRILAEISDTHGLAHGEGEPVLCPCLPLPASWAEYLAGVSSATRKEIKRKLKRFTNHFATRLVDVNDEGEIDGAMAHLLRLNRLRHKDKGEHGAFTDPRFMSFHQRAIPDLAAHGRARILLLLANDEPVAVQYLLCEGDRWYSYQGGFDPRLGRYAPGTVLDALAIRHAIEEKGVRVFDFLRGVERYKLRLGAVAQPNRQITVFNLTPRALAALAIQRFVEAVRSTRPADEPTPAVAAQRSGSSAETERRTSSPGDDSPPYPPPKAESFSRTDNSQRATGQAMSCSGVEASKMLRSKSFRSGSI